MNVAIGGDHAGFALKQLLADALRKDGHAVMDLGAHSTTPSDYPDFSRAVGDAVASGQAERGIIVCGSGVGACVAANKIKGIRAGICHDTYSGHQGVEHDDMNVLVLGSRVIGTELARELVRSFLGASFSNEKRHLRRVGKVKRLEEKFCGKQKSARPRAKKPARPDRR